MPRDATPPACQLNARQQNTSSKFWLFTSDLVRNINTHTSTAHFLDKSSNRCRFCLFLWVGFRLRGCEMENGSENKLWDKEGQCRTVLTPYRGDKCDNPRLSEVLCHLCLKIHSEDSIHIDLIPEHMSAFSVVTLSPNFILFTYPVWHCSRRSYMNACLAEGVRCW